MATSAKRIWLDIGLNALGGVLSYPLAHGLVFVLGSFYTVPNGIATVIFVTSYSGLVLVFVFRIWNDVRTLTDDVKILIIYCGNESVSTETYIGPTFAKTFDEETYESFQRLLCGFPPEYTVFKFNRLFFLKGISSLPTSKLRHLVINPKAFSQLLGRLKKDDYIRTDGFSFSIQLGKWESKRKEMMENAFESQKWQGIAANLIENNKG